MVRISKVGFARARKLFVALAGGLAVIVATGALHGTALVAANSFLAFATTLGVYRVPNEPTPTPGK